MKRKGKADPGDMELWSRMAQSVRPLRGRTPPPAPRPPEPAEMPALTEMPEPAVPSEAPAPSPSGTPALPFQAQPGSGIDKRTARRLRRGALPIDAKIDLHGLTREEAYRRLTRFIAGNQAAGRRLVLVVTGKGRRSEDGMAAGVIRREAPLWLARPPNAARVLDTAPAQPRHGGDGALYVYLRKQRP